MTNLIKKDFRLVAIGASAGGLEAIEALFKAMPKSTGLSFVVITHLMRKHTSILTELIGKYTKMQVFTINEAIEIEKDCVYVLPPDKNAEIKNSSLITIEQIEPHRENMPIDHFFKSLAEVRGDKSIAVVLSGSGVDGTIGMRAIKKAGGIVIVQTPDTAKFEGMPQSALDTLLADFVLPLDKIAKEIIAIGSAGENSVSTNTIEIRKIYKLLESHTGHDFSDYKINTINRRIERQMLRNHISSIDEYIRLLTEDSELIDSLFEDLLIGVTSFFRDNMAFEALKTAINLKLSNHKSDEDAIRVWIPGCSTGEEAYTVAIIILECITNLKLKLKAQIFATDIDNKALAFARAAIYHKSEVSNLTPERLNNFFTRENNQYKLKKEVREIVTFGFQNIILDPPFTKLDLICCRNLLIYFNTDLQKKIFRVFHYSLKSKGLLFLGLSEAVTGYSGLFRLIMKDWKIYERNDSASNSAIMLHYPAVKRYPETKLPLNFETPLDDKVDLGNFVAKHFLGTFISATIIINIEGKILYTQGNINVFIKDLLTDSQNIFDAMPVRLKNKISSAIKNSLETQVEIGLSNLKTNVANNNISFNILILPVTQIETDLPLVCLYFQNIVTKEQIDFVVGEHGAGPEISKKIIAMQQELEFTKETLQTTIEELQSNNEELQSTNEELQSTVEEIETSKEELLSLNEELIIVNSELQTRIDLSTSVTEDLNNLFNSTQIIAIFLDTNLCIKLFTPRVDEIMNLRPHDIGRPWRHFANNLKYNDFAANFKEVISQSKEMTFEIESFDHRWFQIRIIPYITLLNTTDGVVITFNEITDHKFCLLKLQESHDVLASLLNTIFFNKESNV